jgi:hypothetical protein
MSPQCGTSRYRCNRNVGRAGRDVTVMWGERVEMSPQSGASG